MLGRWLLLGGLAVGLAACGAHEDAATAEEELVATVATTAVVVREFVEQVEAPGAVAALPEHVHVVIPVYGGALGRLHVTVGSRIRAGDPIADVMLDPIAVADIERLRRARAVAERALDRQRQAFAAGVTARVALEAAESDAVNARAELAARTQGYELARRSVTLRAPASGLVITADVRAGQAVDANTVVATIVDTGALAVVARADGAAMGRVAVGQAAIVTVDGGEPSAAVVVRVAATLDPGSQRADVWLRPAPPALLPGAFVSVAIQAGVSTLPSIPRRALVKTDAGYRVFTVTDEHATARDVTIGMITDEAVAIQAGVAVGEQVVTDGAQELADGMRVTIGVPAGDH